MRCAGVSFFSPFSFPARHHHHHHHPPTPLTPQSIAILRAADTAVKTRLQLKLTLSQSEHALVTNARKRPYCLHLVCLRRDSLYPAQWPDGLTVRADGKPAAVPHASWRNKDESRDWCRVVSPVDLTACVSPLNRTLYVTVESTKVHQSVVIAVCLVENKGITAVCEEVKERVAREHEERVRRRAAAAGTETMLTPPLARDAGCEEISVDRTTVALYDPVTMTRVQYPVKGARCSHPGAFDLFTYIHFCCSSRMWVCPECEEPCGPTHSLQYDAYFHDVLQSEEVAADPDATHVVMHADGTWVLKPVEPAAGTAGGGGAGGGGAGAATPAGGGGGGGDGGATPAVPSAKRRRQSADEGFGGDTVVLDGSEGDGDTETDTDTDTFDLPGLSSTTSGGGGGSGHDRRRRRRSAPGQVVATETSLPTDESLLGSVECPIEL